MKRGYLSEYFDGVAAKRLSAVEADLLTSNQHEFQGVEGLVAILGEPVGKVPYEAKVIYLDDSNDEPLIEDATFTWYDVREKERLRGGTKSGRMRWEYRLYFPTTNVSIKATVGDLLIIAKRHDGGLLVIVAQNGTGTAQQLQWLFGFSDLTHPGYFVKSEKDLEQDRIEFASRVILESVGVVAETSAEKYLNVMLRKFKGKFPTTREFSTYARSTLKDVNACDDPDAALMAWMEREELLFRTLERHLIADRLSQGFGGGGNGELDVDGFLTFSLSVQNRRKSRVGLALENHLEFLFLENDLRHTRTAVTENKSKPDFLFPGIVEYRDTAFTSSRLTMLGVKSTCKDRWRQVLAEADRIDNKHLLTLEASISTQQTNEMTAKSLQLVLPRALHQTYTPQQQSRLMDVSEFTALARERQKA